MEPAALIAFSKTLVSFVDNIKATRRLRREQDELLALIRKARAEFELARSAAREAADELHQYTEAARATDEISRTMTELGTLLAVDASQIDWIFLRFEVDRLRHHGPLNNLVRFKNNVAIQPGEQRNELFSAIERIDHALSELTVSADAADTLQGQVSGIIQACDTLYRVRNRVVNEFAMRLGNALTT